METGNNISYVSFDPAGTQKFDDAFSIIRDGCGFLMSVVSPDMTDTRNSVIPNDIIRKRSLRADGTSKKVIEFVIGLQNRYLKLITVSQKLVDITENIVYDSRNPQVNGIKSEVAQNTYQLLKQAGEGGDPIEVALNRTKRAIGRDCAIKGINAFYKDGNNYSLTPPERGSPFICCLATLRREVDRVNQQIVAYSHSLIVPQVDLSDLKKMVASNLNSGSTGNSEPKRETSRFATFGDRINARNIRN